jgi:hypothetical protein
VSDSLIRISHWPITLVTFPLRRDTDLIYVLAIIPLFRRLRTYLGKDLLIGMPGGRKGDIFEPSKPVDQQAIVA